MLNHNLPIYNLPKCCFNDANIVLRRSPQWQTVLKRRTSVGLQAEQAPSDPRPRGRHCSESANCEFIVRCAKNMFFLQIVSRQIVGNKFGVGQSVNFHFLANCPLPNRYAPVSKRLQINLNLNQKWNILFCFVFSACPSRAAIPTRTSASIASTERRRTKSGRGRHQTSEELSPEGKDPKILFRLELSSSGKSHGHFPFDEFVIFQSQHRN